MTRSDNVNVTVASASLSAYAQGVLTDGAGSFWRLGEASGNTFADWAGWADAVVGPGVTRGTPGAIVGMRTLRRRFGIASGCASTQTSIPGPSVFSAETWIKTTTTAGGKILGFGDRSTGTSIKSDRHVYMDNSGKIFFGVNNGVRRTLSTARSYNDGNWHQIMSWAGE